MTDNLQFAFTTTETLTTADVKRHISHHVDVPEGCNKLTVTLHFKPAELAGVRNMLTLTVFDPDGFRGAGHRGGNTHHVTITAGEATAGYLAGPLPAGAWTFQIDTHMILPGEPCTYELTVMAEKTQEAIEPLSARSRVDFSAITNPKPGWYRGDLHTHTLHSDASWNVAELLAAAQEQELDFIALTDHNTVSGLTEMASSATPDLLTLGGQELTTFYGHAVCLGATDWIDWRVTQQGGEVAAIAEEVYARDQIFIIAHPYAIGDPYCTGCRWLYPGMMPGPARFVEVWNGSWWGEHPVEHNKNEDGLALWYRWLNVGRRMVATAGSDAHSPKHYARGCGFSVVYAETLSEQGIMSGLRAGHLYLSAGPALHLSVDTAHTTAMMGDLLELDGGAKEIVVTAAWSEVPDGSSAQLIVHGAVQATRPASGQGRMEWLLPAYGARWCTVELRSANGEMLAVTNPIFFRLP